MKKLIIVALVMVMLAGTAFAESKDKVSVAMMEMIMETLSDSAEGKILFDFDKSGVVIDGDGDIMINFESNISLKMLAGNEQTAINFVCLTWTGFHDIHKIFSDTPIYVAIRYGSDTLFFTGGDVVIDYYNHVHPFVVKT